MIRVLTILLLFISTAVYAQRRYQKVGQVAGTQLTTQKVLIPYATEQRAVIVYSEDAWELVATKLKGADGDTIDHRSYFIAGAMNHIYFVDAASIGERIFMLVGIDSSGVSSGSALVEIDTSLTLLGTSYIRDVKEPVTLDVLDSTLYLTGQSDSVAHFIKLKGNSIIWHRSAPNYRIRSASIGGRRLNTVGCLDSACSSAGLLGIDSLGNVQMQKSLPAASPFFIAIDAFEHIDTSYYLSVRDSNVAAIVRLDGNFNLQAEWEFISYWGDTASIHAFSPYKSDSRFFIAAGRCPGPFSWDVWSYVMKVPLDLNHQANGFRRFAYGGFESSKYTHFVSVDDSILYAAGTGQTSFTFDSIHRGYSFSRLDTHFVNYCASEQTFVAQWNDSMYLSTLPLNLTLQVESGTLGSLTVGTSPFLPNYYVKFCFTNGLDDLDFNQAISIYPSPATDFVTLDAPFSFTPSQVRILNAMGQDCPIEWVGSSTFTVSNLIPGVYFVEIRNESKRVVGKLVVR